MRAAADILLSSEADAAAAAYALCRQFRHLRLFSFAV